MVGIELVLAILYLFLLLLKPVLEFNLTFLFLQLLLDSVVLFLASYFTGGPGSPFLTVLPLLSFLSAISLPGKYSFPFTLLLLLYPLSLRFVQVYGSSPFFQENLLKPLLNRDFPLVISTFLLGWLPLQVRKKFGDLTITFQKLQNDFHSQKALTQLLIEEIPTGVAILKKNGSLVLLNPAGEKILSFLTPKQEKELWKEIVQETPGSRREKKIGFEKDAHFIGYTLFPLRDTVLGDYIVVFQDLTLLKKVQEQEMEQARLNTLLSVATRLAHEIRNPLSALFHSLELLKENATEDQEKLLAILTKEGERLNRLLHDFLHYAHPQPHWIRPISLKEFLEQTLERFTEHPQTKEKEIQIQIQPLPRKVMGDEELLREIMDNLILNALEWSFPGSSIRIHCEEENGTVHLYVENEGKTIPEEDQKRIFEPFFSRRKEGTGLGLAIAWSNARVLQGSLELKESKNGKTVFHLTLPILQE